jgi:hypothetical protein
MGPEGSCIEIIENIQISRWGVYYGFRRELGIIDYRSRSITGVDIVCSVGNVKIKIEIF